MSTMNLAAQGNQNINYGQTGNLGGYLLNSGSAFLQSGLTGNGWSIKSAFGDPSSGFNAKWGKNGSLTGYDNAIGAVAGFAGNYLDSKAEHQRTSGKYGYLASTVDIIGDVGSAAGLFNPIATGAGKLAMGAVNNITGGTDGMTVQDSLLGSSSIQGALTGLAAATGPIGWGVAGAYLLASGINSATGATTTDNAYKSFMDKDKLTEVSDAYTDMDLENEAESLYNKKYGGFSRGAYKKAQKKVEEALMRMTNKIDIRDTAKLGQIRAGMVDANRLNYQMAINGGYRPTAIGRQGLKIDPERLAEAKRIAKCVKKKKSPIFNIIPAEAREAMRDVTKVPNDALPFFQEGGNIELFQNGGDVNVIPEGALHARKHHMEDDEHITKKGIPVVDLEGKQQAEIECNEIIFRKEVTSKLEELAKDGSDEAAIEAGKLLAIEIIENTDDRTGLINNVVGGIPKASQGMAIANAVVSGLQLMNAKKQQANNQQELADITREKRKIQDELTKGSVFQATNAMYSRLGPLIVDKKTGTVVESPNDINIREFINPFKADEFKAASLRENYLQERGGKDEAAVNQAGDNLFGSLSQLAGVFMKNKEDEDDSDDGGEDGGGENDPQSGQEGMKIPSLEEYIELKIKERTKAAILKATTRKYPYMFKNKNWKNCIATLSDNYGVPIILRNSDLATDPNKYGFEELLFGDNTDTLPDGVIIQDYNKDKDISVPGHSIMLVGRDDKGAPVYSWSQGDSNAKSMINQSLNYFFRRWDDKVKPRAYRYIGTPAERKAWEEEYYILYPKKFEDGGVLEELSKLSPEKLKELSAIIKYLNQ